MAGGYNDWPTGRGIFFNEDKTFLVWVNEEDHLRLISMQKGGDIGAVYKRLVKVGTHSGVCFRVEEMWGHRGSVQETRQGRYPFRGLFYCGRNVGTSSQFTRESSK